MRRLVTKKVLYQCRVCRTKYGDRRTAASCEAKPVEPARFKVGDRVTARERRTCQLGRAYVMTGKVIAVHGPQPPDEEYEIKWLGCRAERLGSHVRQYEVHYRCPRCGRIKTALYYGPELRPV